jgi:hypothetical protein
MLEQAKMPREWQPIVEEMPRVGKLVHLAVRMDGVDEEATRIELLRLRRRAYENELTIQAARVGCPGRVGRLGNGAVLSELNEMCVQDAKSIINTFNYDLSNAINQIRSETPTANRFVYASRLRDWEVKRNDWKNKQIAQYTELSARALAVKNFFEFNSDILGIAVLDPRLAVCPICQGWIERGEVPLQIATNNPPPYHVNCPHYWRTILEKVAKEECPLLWMGE